MTAPKRTAKVAHARRKRRLPPPQKCFAGARHLKFLVVPPRKVIACALCAGQTPRFQNILKPGAFSSQLTKKHKHETVAWFFVQRRIKW